MPPASFSPLNYAVLFVYLAAMLYIGWRLAGRQTTTEEFFLAGRRLPWLAVAMSMYASVTSAATFMGLPGLAYADNTSLLVVSLMSPAVAPILIFLFYPFYRRRRMTTSYEYAALRFGPGARYAVAVLFILARLGWLGLVIYAPALALSVVTGLPLWASILLMGVVTTVYTAMGGLSAVVWTDVVQFLIMIVGALWLAVALWRDVPGGAAEIWRVAAGSGRLTFLDWSFDPGRMTGLAVAIAYLFILMQDYGVDQVSVQRLLAVRSNRGVAKAIAFNALTDFLIVGVLLFVGVGMLAYFRHAGEALPPEVRGDRVLPYFIVHKLPDGVSGLLVTAIFAAAMSSMDSGLNSLATVAVHDLFRPLARAGRVEEAADLRLAKRLTTGLGVFATALAFGVARIGGIVKAFYTFMGLFSAPVLALFLLGMLTRRARFVPWLAGAAASIAATLALQRTGVVDEIYLFPFSFALTYAVGYLASLPSGRAPGLAGLTVWDRPAASDAKETA